MSYGVKLGDLLFESLVSSYVECDDWKDVCDKGCFSPMKYEIFVYNGNAQAANEAETIFKTAQVKCGHAQDRNRLLCPYFVGLLKVWRKADKYAKKMGYGSGDSESDASILTKINKTFEVFCRYYEDTLRGGKDNVQMDWSHLYMPDERDPKTAYRTRKNTGKERTVQTRSMRAATMNEIREDSSDDESDRESILAEGARNAEMEVEARENEIDDNTVTEMENDAELQTDEQRKADLARYSEPFGQRIVPPETVRNAEGHLIGSTPMPPQPQQPLFTPIRFPPRPVFLPTGVSADRERENANRNNQGAGGSGNGGGGGGDDMRGNRPMDAFADFRNADGDDIGLYTWGLIIPRYKLNSVLDKDGNFNAKYEIKHEKKENDKIVETFYFRSAGMREIVEKYSGQLKKICMFFDQYLAPFGLLGHLVLAGALSANSPTNYGAKKSYEEEVKDGDLTINPNAQKKHPFFEIRDNRLHMTFQSLRPKHLLILPMRSFTWKELYQLFGLDTESCACITNYATGTYCAARMGQSVFNQKKGIFKRDGPGKPMRFHLVNSSSSILFTNDGLPEYISDSCSSNHCPPGLRLCNITKALSKATDDTQKSNLTTNAEKIMVGAGKIANDYENQQKDWGPLALAIEKKLCELGVMPAWNKGCFLPMELCAIPDDRKLMSYLTTVTRSNIFATYIVASWLGVLTADLAFAREFIKDLPKAVEVSECVTKAKERFKKSACLMECKGRAVIGLPLMESKNMNSNGVYNSKVPTTKRNKQFMTVTNMEAMQATWRVKGSEDLKPTEKMVEWLKINRDGRPKILNKPLSGFNVLSLTQAENKKRKLTAQENRKRAEKRQKTRNERMQANMDLPIVKWLNQRVETIDGEDKTSSLQTLLHSISQISERKQEAHMLYHMKGYKNLLDKLNIAVGISRDNFNLIVGYYKEEIAIIRRFVII